MTTPLLVAAVVVPLLGGCAPGPVEIRYGEDECAACRMRITDRRFASQLVMRTGKVHKFDAIECLIGFSEREGLTDDAVHSRWVTDFARPGTLIDVRTAKWLRTAAARSPMGLGVLAFADEEELARARATYGGSEVAWNDLPALRRTAAGSGSSGAASAPPQ